MDPVEPAETALSPLPGIGASLNRNPNIVAMFGWIIPLPFATPVTRNDGPLRSSTATVRTFGTRSVVMIACANSPSPFALALVTSCGSFSRIFSTGSRAPITPVDR